MSSAFFYGVLIGPDPKTLLIRAGSQQAGIRVLGCRADRRKKRHSLLRQLADGHEKMLCSFHAHKRVRKSIWPGQEFSSFTHSDQSLRV